MITGLLARFLSFLFIAMILSGTSFLLEYWELSRVVRYEQQANPRLFVNILDHDVLPVYQQQKLTGFRLTSEKIVTSPSSFVVERDIFITRETDDARVVIAELKKRGHFWVSPTHNTVERFIPLTDFDIHRDFSDETYLLTDVWSFRTPTGATKVIESRSYFRLSPS